jgi:predicted NAD-dependent protein-ADP-ribosyltransferase YbiA (DUF1768 family)
MLDVTELQRWVRKGQKLRFSALLVEASPMDRIWGIGLAKDADGAHDPLRWPGLDLLGFALMAAREQL